MADSPIAKLFAQLGFKVDRTGLKSFENDLKSLKNKIDSKDGISGATDRTRKKQSALFKEIKSNYTKVRPSLEQMKKDLKRLDGAMFQNKISAEEYGEARKRVTTQISKIETQAHLKNKQQMIRVEKMFDKRNFQLKELRANASHVNRQYRTGNITLEERRRILEGIYREYRRIQSVESGGAGRTGQARTGPFAGGADPRQKGTHGIISALHSDVGLATLAGGFAAAQSVMAYQNFIAMEQGLTAATGSVEQAGEEMEYLMGLSDRMGLFVGDLGKSFTGLAAAAKGTSLEGQGVRDVFKGVASQARVLNLSAADTQGVMTAVTQIMNKGTVMAEELKNQLGERLPGSMQAAARAVHKMGLTQEATVPSLLKLVETGKLASEEFLPVFAEELWESANAGGALAAAMSSTGAAIGRFRTNLWKANKTFNEAGFDRNVRILINVFSDFLKMSDGLFKFFGQMSWFIIAPLRAFGETIRFLGSSFGNFVDESQDRMDAMMALVGVFLSLFKWGRKLLVVFLLLPIAISGLVKWMEEGALATDEWVVTLAAAAGSLLLILNRLKGIKGLRGVFGGGAAAAGGVGAGTAAAAGSALSNTALAAAGSVILGAAAVGALTADVVENPETALQRVEPSKFGSPVFTHDMGGGSNAFSNWLSRGELKTGSDPFSMNDPAALQKRLMEGRGPSMTVNGGITFEISGDNSTEIADEVIRTIQEMFIRPASMNDPITEK